MSILREVVGAVCCCLPTAPTLERNGRSRDLKRLSDWRAHPTLRQYDLEKHIADGGFSEIWLARHRTSGEEQCLKVVYLRKPGLRAEDAEVLRGEARFLRHLEHPGLVRCRDVFETKYHMVMILEHLTGGEMLRHLHRVEHYSEGEAARLFAQVVAAVAYMHNLNIVHRDIKPENVMFARRVEECMTLGRPLRVKLIDLGMATVLLPAPHEGEEEQQQQGEVAPGQGRGGGLWGRRQQQQRRKAGQAEGLLARERWQRQRAAPCGCLGSPGFIAPEAVNGSPHTFAMDVYSLGVMLFVMLTGRKPWPMREVRNLSYARRPIAEAPGLKDASFLALSPAARELLLTMLADDPRDRPTCGAVLRHPFLTSAVAGGGPGVALQAPLDDVIKRRIAQLASLRRFRGLAFAMMSSHQEGQRLSEFLEALAERRKALHRDLVSRAKLRRSVERQRRRLHDEEEQQQQQQQREREQEEQRLKGRQAGTIQPQQLQLAARRLRAGGSGDTAQAATVSLRAASYDATAVAAATYAVTRVSLDSVSSQQPLLPSQNDSHLPLPHRQPDLHPDRSRGGEGDGDDPHPDAHKYDQYDPHAVRHSTESLGSGTSSRQPLMRVAFADHDGVVIAPLPSHHPSHQLASCRAQYPLPAGSASPLKVERKAAHAGGIGATAAGTHAPASGHGEWRSSLNPSNGGATGILNMGARGQHPHYLHHHHHLHQHYPSLAPVAGPGEATGSEYFTQPQPQPWPQGAPGSGPIGASAGAAPPSRSRGWSSSGCQQDSDLAPAAAGAAPADRSGGCGGLPPHPPQRRHGGGAATAAAGGGAAGPRGRRGGVRRSRNSELQLAALDPLSLIRGLPGGCRLGRSHSAPESLAAAEQSILGGGGWDGGGARYGVRAGEGGKPGARGAVECAGDDGGGRGPGAVMSSDGTATWLERLAMGADMRAFSASSWTLDLLANEELLAALTGINVARVSSSNADGTVYDGALYGVGTSSLSQGTLDAAVSAELGLGGFGSGSAAGAVGAGVASGGAAAAPAAASAAAAAAAAVAAFQRLQSDWSNRGARTSSSALEATVHAASQAAALLAAARMSRDGRPTPAAVAAGLRVSSSGGNGSIRRWPPGSGGGALAAGAAVSAASVETPIKSTAARTQVQSPSAAAAAPVTSFSRGLIAAAPEVGRCHLGVQQQQQGPPPGSKLAGSCGVSPFAAMAWAPYLGAKPVGATHGENGRLEACDETDWCIKPGALAAAARSRALFSGTGGGGGGTAAAAAASPSWHGAGGFAPLPRGSDSLSDDNSSVQSAYAREGAPMPLVRAARGSGLDDPEGMYGIASYDLPYTSRHRSAASSRSLAVALSAAMPIAAPTHIGGLAGGHGAGATGAGSLAAVAAAGAVGMVMRRPSLALTHTDEHVAARQATLEQTLHGGDMWLRSLLALSPRPGPSPGGTSRLGGAVLAAQDVGAGCGGGGGGGVSSGGRCSTGDGGSGGADADVRVVAAEAEEGPRGRHLPGAAAGWQSPAAQQGSCSRLARTSKGPAVDNSRGVEPPGSKAATPVAMQAGGGSAAAGRLPAVACDAVAGPTPSATPTVRVAPTAFPGHAAACPDPALRARWRSPFGSLAAAPLRDAEEAGLDGGGSCGASAAARG